METNMSFEDLFLRASDFIGCDESTVVDALGDPEKSNVSSSGTKVLFYLSYDILFMIPNSGIVERVGSPITLTNSKIESGYFNLHGVSLGDTKDRVARVWGTPSENTERVWVYSDKTGTTSNGLKFVTELTFKDGIIEDFQSKIFRPSTSKPKSGCFVATACYGDYNAAEVLVLRNYRDNVLLKTNLGRFAVDVYYIISPPIARLLDKSESLKAFIRKNILAPIVSKIKKNQ